MDITIYGGPGCQRCNVTKARLRKAGIEYTEAEADAHPELIPMIEKLGLTRQLPVVVVTRPDEETLVWTGLDPMNLRALEYLAAE